MRTTVALDDSLLADAKREAARTGRTLSRVLEEALRESLSRRRGSETARQHLQLPTFPGKGLQPGVDLDSSAALLDMMERNAPG